MLCIIQARYTGETKWTCVGAAETPEIAHQHLGVARHTYGELLSEMPEFRIVGVEMHEVLWPSPEPLA